MAVTHLLQNQQEAGRRWKFGECEFIEIRRELLVRGEPVRLESKPLEVLQHLLEHPAQVLTKDELIGAAWAISTTDQSLTTAIAKLRKAFGGARDSVILSVSGVGYRMAVQVACEVVDEVPPPLRLQAGDTVPGRPNWKVVKSLAAGGPHSVWLAEHAKTREARVFKFATDGVRLRALQREVTLSRLLRQALGDDAGFVRILDWDFEREPFFIESEYGGLNLFEWSDTEEFANLPLPGRVALAAEIVETVAAAHALGILHNDLKPANVLVVSDAADSDLGAGRRGSWQIKVADFGVASVSDLQRLVELQITHYGSFEEKADGQNGATTPIGTAMYRAPELLAGGAPSIQGDVYALGVMLYQIVCGDFLETPSVGWESRIADPVLRQDIADAANIDPSRRIGTASELAARLRTLESRRTEIEVRAAEIAAGEQARRAMENARLRRPWLVFAMVALVVGLCASLWFYRKAVRQRDLANSRNETLSAMNDFLTVDLLGQSNPLAGTGRPGQPQQETLIEAIDTASPKIDSRFAKAPATAGQLHESIAAALDARTEYAAAEREFQIAAQRFRQAEGPLSQNALICEFRRENTQVRSRSPEMLKQAKLGFSSQQETMAKLPGITAETQAWAALAETAISVPEGHPKEATQSLNAAIQRAESTSNFNSSLLMNLRLRYCPLYIGEGDWVGVERVARQIIDSVASSRGPGSPALFQPQMFLQEALFMQGKYAEALAQGNANYPQFLRVLGPQNQLTLAALQMVGETEGAMGDNKDAIRDSLALHDADQPDPAGRYIAANSLNSAAELECNSGRFQDGLGHARQVIRENSAQPAQPVFISMGRFTIAECQIEEAEGQGIRHDSSSLAEADALLKSIDVPLVAHTPGLASFPAYFNVAQARLALLRGQTSQAKEFADKVAPIENQPGFDPCEKKALARIEAALGRHS